MGSLFFCAFFRCSILSNGSNRTIISPFSVLPSGSRRGEDRQMDILKLCDKLFEDADLQDIPIDYIFRVVKAVITAMADGDCFYKDEFD